MLDLNVLSKISYLFLFLLLLANLYFRYILKIEYTKYFILFSINMIVGIYLVFFINVIPDFLSMIVSTMLIALGEIFLYIGVKGLLGLDSGWKMRYLILLTILFIGYVLFTYVYYDIAFKMMITSSYFIGFDAFIAWLFIKDKNQEHKITNIITSIVFLMGSGIFTLMFLDALFGNVNSNYLSNKSFFVLFPYLYLCAFCLWMIFLVFIYRNNKNL